MIKPVHMIDSLKPSMATIIYNWIADQDWNINANLYLRRTSIHSLREKSQEVIISLSNIHHAGYRRWIVITCMDEISEFMVFSSNRHKLTYESHKAISYFDPKFLDKLSGTLRPILLEDQGGVSYE